MLSYRFVLYCDICIVSLKYFCYLRHFKLDFFLHYITFTHIACYRTGLSTTASFVAEWVKFTSLRTTGVAWSFRWVPGAIKRFNAFSMARSWGLLSEEVMKCAHLRSSCTAVCKCRWDKASSGIRSILVRWIKWIRYGICLKSVG